MTNPPTEQQLAQALQRATDYTKGHAHLGPLCGYACDMANAIPAMVDEIHRLRDELAETKALNDPRLRGLLVKAAPDKDLYVQWSTVCDMPGGVFSRESALAYGFPPSRLDHADKHGSSSRLGDGAWDDKGWVAEQRGWLRRDRIGEYAVEYLHGDREAAYALLEPFDDDEPAAGAQQPKEV